jgi:hypothetical protein
MREIQTNPKQPRDDDGQAHAENDRRRDHVQPEAGPQDESDGAEGRDRPPAGSHRPNSPWLGGG